MEAESGIGAGEGLEKRGAADGRFREDGALEEVSDVDAIGCFVRRKTRLDKR